MTDTIAIIDYGAGNLRSIYKAIEKVCIEKGSSLRPVVTSDRRKVEAAMAVVLPGVGAAGPTMTRLVECDLVEPLRVAAERKPFLGVCLGLQLLFMYHEEGSVEGLGILPGTARLFDIGLKVPHMGWNRLYSSRHAMFEGIAHDAYFYYVHSYYAQPQDSSTVIGTTEYGQSFPGALARDNLWATQFHPEKSGADGLRLLRNFVSHAEAA